MDREEALKLLCGGKEGIVAWNEYRRRGGEIPCLNDIHTVYYADLTGDDLIEPRFNTDLGGSMLHGGDLLGANFKYRKEPESITG